MPLPAPPSRRSLVALITGAMALATAILAHMKKPEEPAARESYLVLQKAVEGVAAEADSCQEKLEDVTAAFEEHVRRTRERGEPGALGAGAGQGDDAVRPPPKSKATATPPGPHAVPSTSSTVALPIILPSALPMSPFEPPAASSATASSEEPVVHPRKTSKAKRAPLPPFSDIEKSAR